MADDTGHDIGGGQSEQNKYTTVHPARKAQDTDNDEDDSDLTDTESMFDMFTGELNDACGPGTEAVDDTRSEVSWEDVEEHEHTKFDVDMRMFEREFVYLPKASSVPPADETPKDVRIMNAGATELYEWKPLTDASGIYILDMLPATEADEPVQAQMRLSERVNYWVVSHCTGPSERRDSVARTKSVPCDGKILRVTPEVYDMLHRIRDLLDQGIWTEFSIRPCIWVDAVCIDPDSPSEQTGHVQGSADIFQGAQGTIIDLGNDAYDARTIFAVAEALWTAHKADPALDEWPVDVQDRDDTVESMQEFVSHPWFSRRSTIEEFAVHKRRTVVCGRNTIRFETLFNLMTYLDIFPPVGPIRHAPEIDSLWPRTWLFANLYRYRFSPSHTYPISDVLTLTCSCKPRGSYHGPLPWCGRARCGTRPDPSTPDYSPALYIDLAHDYARENSTTAVLALAAAFPSPPSSAHRLPSWVPDWASAHASPDLAPAVRETLDSALAYPDADGMFALDAENAIWGFPPVGRTPGEPGEKSGVCLGVRTDGQGRRLLQVRGWILERPADGTKPEAVDWESWGTYPGARPVSARGLTWKSEKVRFLKERGVRVRVTDVEDGWTAVRRGEVVLFVPCCELMFVLGWVEEVGAYRLVRFLKRTAVIDKPRFVFVDQQKGEVWAYGHLTRPSHMLEIV